MIIDNKMSINHPQPLGKNQREDKCAEKSQYAEGSEDY